MTMMMKGREGGGREEGEREMQGCASAAPPPRVGTVGRCVGGRRAVGFYFGGVNDLRARQWRQSQREPQASPALARGARRPLRRL